MCIKTARCYRFSMVCYRVSMACNRFSRVPLQHGVLPRQHGVQLLQHESVWWQIRRGARPNSHSTEIIIRRSEKKQKQKEKKTQGATLQVQCRKEARKGRTALAIHVSAGPAVSSMRFTPNRQAAAGPGS